MLEVSTDKIADSVEGDTFSPFSPLIPPSSAHNSIRPELSPAALHGLAGEFVRLNEPHTEGDPIAMLTQLIVGIGNILDTAPHYYVDTYTPHRTNLFVAIVGATGSGRKGTSWNPVERVLEAVDSAWKDEAMINGLASGEALITNLAEAEDKRRLIHVPEFAQLLRTQQRHGNILEDIVRQVWDKPKISILRRKSQESQTVDDAHISIIGHITESELKSLLTKVERDNGYANRFLWIYAAQSKVLAFPTKPDEDAMKDFISRLCKAVEAAKTIGEMRMSEEAGSLWEPLSRKLVEDTYDCAESLQPFLQRNRPQVIRLAMIYAALSGEAVIQPEHLLAGYALWQYSVDSVRHIFEGSDIQLSPEQRKFFQRLELRGSIGMTETQHNDLFKGKRGKELLESDRRKLRDEFHLVIDRQLKDTGGRPRTIWYSLKHDPLATDAGRQGEKGGIRGKSLPPPSGELSIAE